MPSIMDCSGPNLKCWISKCPFASITQKGLTIHLQKVHNMRYRERSRAAKAPRPRRKNAPAREKLEAFADPSWYRPFVCNICFFKCSTKEDLSHHHQQVHTRGTFYAPRNHHQPSLNLNNPPDTSAVAGGSRNRLSARPEPAQYTYHRCEPASQCTRAARPIYDSFYSTDQVPVRADGFHEPAPGMLQEPVSQDEQFDRGQTYDVQRSVPDWATCGSSAQTPRRMSAEFAAAIQSRGNENENTWIPQISTQRIDDSSAMQLWSTIDPMQSLQYDPKKESINVPQVQPCVQCGCASRGGCSQKPEAPEDVNRIILVDEEAGGSQNGAENHEIYHLQAGSSFGNLRASNVKQVINQGDFIVIECQTDDGREQVSLRAVRAEQGAQEQLDSSAEPEEMTLASASSPVEERHMESNLNALEDNNYEQKPTAEEEPQSSAPIVQPAEESTQSTLPQLFPELFDDCLDNSETKTIVWQPGEAEESGNFFEACERSEYLTALSHCRGSRDDSGSLIVQCGRCSFCTGVGEPLEQIKIHIRDHMEKHFQCADCEFKSLLREEMLVHVGTQHDVARTEPLYRSHP